MRHVVPRQSDAPQRRRAQASSTGLREVGARVTAAADTSSASAAGTGDRGPAVAPLPLGNDAISSIHVPAGRRVRAYQNGGYQGVMKTYTGSVATMPDFNDTISSLCVDRVAF
jgi:hypothetical protein